MLSQRPRGTSLPNYSPQRDLAHLTKPLIKALATRLPKEQWPDWLRRQEQPADHLISGWLAMAKVLELAPLERIDSFADAYVESSLAYIAEHDPRRYAAFMALFGELMLAQAFVAMRDEIRLNDASATAGDAAQLVEQAKAELSWLCLPRWQRWVTSWLPRRWVERWLRRWALAQEAKIQDRWRCLCPRALTQEDYL